MPVCLSNALKVNCMCNKINLFIFASPYIKKEEEKEMRFREILLIQKKTDSLSDRELYRTHRRKDNVR